MTRNGPRTGGEILRGGIMAGWSEAKVGEWERRLRVYTVIPGSIRVARAYGRIGARYHRQVADNDLWIAATALAYELPIATLDEQLGTVATAFGIELVGPPMATRCLPDHSNRSCSRASRMPPGHLVPGSPWS